MAKRIREKLVIVTGRGIQHWRGKTRRFAAQGADINRTWPAGRYATIHALQALLGLR
jgi:hypothetical protein